MTTAQQTQMQAPAGGYPGTATIEGHQYKIPKSGVIDVVHGDHVETLRRHGFTEYTDPRDAAQLIEDATDNEKQWLVTYIEEHGEDADMDMKLKKLKRLARECNEADK